MMHIEHYKIPYWVVDTVIEPFSGIIDLTYLILWLLFILFTYCTLMKIVAPSRLSEAKKSYYFGSNYVVFFSHY